MGQTQILMIVLAVIIVGIAVAAGISMFGKSAVTANRDAVQADCMTVLSQAQQYYKKPTEMGGGGRTWTGLTLGKLNFTTPNVNGSYAIAIAADVLTVTGTGVETGVSCVMTCTGATGAIATTTLTP